MADKKIVKLVFSREKFAQQFIDWVADLIDNDKNIPWLQTSETMMVMSSVDEESRTISFTGMSASEGED